MSRKAKPKTTQAQLDAVKAYQEGKSRFILWYPTAKKDRIDRELARLGLTARDAFELGLERAGIAPQHIRG